MKLLKPKGFTLIEVLLVISIIAVLASIVIIAINPLRQLAAARNAQRSMNINAIHKALLQYTVAHGSLPTTVSTSSIEICRSNATDCTGLLDLSVLSNNAEYMTALPIDPSVSSVNSTGYMVYKTAAGRPVVYAPLAELGEVIDTSNNSSNVKCTPNCSGKCNIPDGCGGICPNNCSGGKPYCTANVCSATKPTPCSETTAAATECTASSAYGAICGGGYLVCKTGDANSNDCGNINLVAAPSNCTGTSGNMGTVCNCSMDTLTKTWNDTNPGSALGLNDAVYGLNNFSDGTDGTTATPFYTGNTANYDAAKYCFDLSITVGGVTYSDWYLPAAKELAAIIKSSEPFYSYSSTKGKSNAYYGEGTTNNGTLAGLQTGAHYNAVPLITASADSRVSGLRDTYYWSSTEYSASYAWFQYPLNGYQSADDKTVAHYVRCVRRF